MLTTQNKSLFLDLDAIQVILPVIHCMRHLLNSKPKTKSNDLIGRIEMLVFNWLGLVNNLVVVLKVAFEDSYDT